LVDPHTLSMLDLSLFMMRGANNDRHVESIVEYNWHGRGEAKVEDTSLLQDSGVRLNEMMKNGVFDESAAKASKVIATFSLLNRISIANALKELKKRARFLAAMSDQKERGRGQPRIHSSVQRKRLDAMANETREVLLSGWLFRQRWLSQR